jgi:hypothetical protein
MKDKSVAMPCGESKPAARASLIKHVIDAKAIKARRCIAFPQRRSTLQSVTILITLQRHTMLWIDNLIRPAAVFATGRGQAPGRTLSRRRERRAGLEAGGGGELSLPEPNSSSKNAWLCCSAPDAPRRYPRTRSNADEVN